MRIPGALATFQLYLLFKSFRFIYNFTLAFLKKNKQNTNVILTFYRWYLNNTTVFYKFNYSFRDT